MKPMNIAVLLGGYSAERDVSLASGLRIAEALRGLGHTVTCVDPAAVDARGVLGRAEEARLVAAGVGTTPPSLEALAGLGYGQKGIRPDLANWPAVRDAAVCFLALHGGQGEDGTLQALLDMAGVRYTGSGHLASAIAMDKHLSKVLFRAAGVGTADWRMAPRAAATDGAARARFCGEVVNALGLPVIVKPSKQGSSVALTVVRDAADLWPAVDLAFRYDDAVMVEQFVAGRELTVGILGDPADPASAMPVIEIIPSTRCTTTSASTRRGWPRSAWPTSPRPRRRRCSARRGSPSPRSGSAATRASTSGWTRPGRSTASRPTRCRG
jgi:D-alanine-D-alanine ligase